MNFKRFYVTGFSLMIAAALAVAWVAFEQSPVITTVSMIIGFPGFVFGMMIFPGVHADKHMIVSVMIIVNAIFYFMVISLLLKYYRNRVAQRQAMRLEGSNQ